ncbi:MAG: symmetrical bis(5'-nucleosyl)-tetraphosphatase, partial [Gammaproteobacteria bacterium]
FEDVLHAKDSESLIDWLRHRPLLHHDEALGYTMIHAGLPPQWNLDTAKQCADEMQKVLRGKKIKKFLAHMYGNKPNLWSEDLKKWDRLRFITNSFTRLRYCTEEGRQDFKENGPLGTQPEHLHPWFRIKNRESKDLKLVFGHWATLGQVEDDNIFTLDSACVWGRGLTAMKLGETPEYFQIPCKGARVPVKKLSRMSTD